MSKVCKMNVGNMEECEKAAETFTDVIYSSLIGNSSNLPHGCIIDTLTPGKKFVYWNKETGIESLDESIRHICRDD